MYPWRRVLIPTDFSTASEWAFDDAIHIAGQASAELVILHVRITEKQHPDELRFPADDRVYEYAERFEIDKLRERARRANSKVQTRLVVKKAPDPGAEICRTAHEENADLIVISTHARHHVAHLLIGSTTMNVLSEPPAPTLAIRYGIPKLRAMRQILVPVHTKQTSDAAAELAAAIARREQATVHLVIVCNENDRAAADQRANEVASRIHDVNPKKVVLFGNEVEPAVVKYIKDSKIDCLFINAQKEIGNVKRDFIRRIDVPVMIVPH